jgi:imidazolonepropionase-like amidohydrolase
LNANGSIKAPARLVFETRRTYVLQAERIVIDPAQKILADWIMVKNGRASGHGQGLPPSGPDLEPVYFGPVVLTPGLIDAHVHLDLDPGDGLDPVGRARRAADLGLAALRDGGDAGLHVLKNRRTIEEYVALAASGAGLFKPGRYGSFLGRTAADRTQSMAVLDELAAAGADTIKVLASGPVSLKEFGRVGPPQFETAELAEIVRQARSRGLTVMAHANGPEAVRNCIEAGAASIEHGYFMGDENLDRLAGASVVWTPTITPLAALLRTEKDPSRREILERTMADQVARLSLARIKGARTAVGTDAGSPGNPVGPSLFEEISWFLRAGYSGLETLAAATVEPAGLLGRPTGLGRLTEGGPAYFAGFPADRPFEETLTNPPIFVGRPGAHTEVGIDD